ncbi:beta-ketoacyl synthase chain length factor [Acidovorax sp.]|uniref:beta-ketoacyl synthase chain length factor n=1 Tax=Acidovorax sp. TaxID=1872122 RepID=UPI00342BD83F
MRVAFAVRAWAAVAPGLQSQEQWLRWADAPSCPVGAAVVELPQVPPMARRRLGHLAKMAVSVADAALVSARSADIPIVWASRYGDAAKSIALLQTQALDEALSPTAFGLSVHNGVGAQHSILRGIRANAVCVASSHCAPEAGVVEAVGLLNDVEQELAEVLLVSYDEPLPSDYAVFHDEPVAEYAWAALLVPLQPGDEGYVLQALDDVPREHGRHGESDALPHGLDVLHFLLQGKRQSLVHGHASGQWMWERVHA